MPTIIVPMAAGFEEIEACTIIDVLRRAEFDVITAGMESKCVCGSHDISIECDDLFVNIDFTDVDGLVLPGGMPGSGNLLASQKLRKIITELNQREKCIAAICAAPWVLAEAGVLNDKNATSYPDFAEKLAKSNYSNRRVVSDGNLITSRGVGTALEFSLTLVEYFKGFDVTKELAEKMLVNWPSDKH